MKRVLFRPSGSFVTIEVKDAASVSERWTGEWGVPRGSLRPGDYVVVSGYPARDPDDHRLFVQTISRPTDGWKWSTSGLPGQLSVLLPGAQ